ncbi:uncharacterized protein LOC127439359 [Myxocyprinus asiaticus]|uniref:uncharacterized protein LOC127439359 n=1 Tax=Myxocyprinus asiaticus TaxID=70543 RepID=UPI0022220255|nr:uncharacterized protein LOC127439359 [Myxocyprinus asiaticus]
MLILLGGIPEPLSGKEGDNITFPCDSGIIEIYNVILKAYGTNQHKEYTGRVSQIGSCTIILTDLRRSDAGLFTLIVYKTSEMAFNKIFIVSIKDEFSLKTGENLTLEVLLRKTERVVHERIGGAEFTPVWIKGKGVQSDRLTESNEDLIIREFIANDSGTYRALDSDGNTLITVNVTENVTESDQDRQHQDNTTSSTSTEGDGLIVGLTLLLVCVLILNGCFWYKDHRSSHK